MKIREVMLLLLTFVAVLGWGHSVWMAREHRQTAEDALQMVREAQSFARDTIDLGQCVNLGNECIERLDLCETSTWACEKLDDDLLRECAEKGDGVKR